MSLQYDKYIKYVKYDINTKYINNEKYNNHSDNFQYFLQWMCSTGRKVERIFLGPGNFHLHFP